MPGQMAAGRNWAAQLRIEARSKRLKRRNGGGQGEQVGLEMLPGSERWRWVGLEAKDGAAASSWLKLAVDSVAFGHLQVQRSA
mmetsp:Transcript_14200/g.26304  ORF Transcript_14200/g.26304 Transcript_14200/m.26304 type:complete len:83 (-) Transcript_14200:419-667(-)